MANIARLVEVIEPEVQALGLDLVRVVYFKGGEIGDEDHTLQVMAEDAATGQLVIEQCAALSHRISDRIDDLEEAGEMLIEDAYRLEVSSPGIDRPLTRAKDYATWAGHEVRFQLTEPVEGNRKSLQGDLIGLDGDVVTLEDKKSGQVTFPFSTVQSAKLVLTDRLLAATRPLDASGAEEEVFGGADEILEEQED